MRRILPLLAASVILVAAAPTAAPTDSYDTHLLIVAGLGGEPEYAESFRLWSQALHASAEKRLGIPRANITYLTESPEKDPGRVDGKSTREEISRAFAKIASKARPGDTVAVILFGHGSGASEESRFNLPGPDATARDFATWLVPFSLQRVVFVNAASASGDFQQVLAGKNRVILTSTKSSQERNESVFGRHFSEALSGEAADKDKDGQVSILEAFDAAKAQVASEYERDRRLLTEHAVLSDGREGSLAKATFLGGRRGQATEASASLNDPALAGLLKERQALEDRVEELKAAKGALPTERYEQELERVLLELAMKNEEIRRKQEGGS